VEHAGQPRGLTVGWSKGLSVPWPLFRAAEGRGVADSFALARGGRANQEGDQIEEDSHLQGMGNEGDPFEDWVRERNIR